jgi:hypothetical protein
VQTNFETACADIAAEMREHESHPVDLLDHRGIDLAGVELFLTGEPEDHWTPFLWGLLIGHQIERVETHQEADHG